MICVKTKKISHCVTANKNSIETHISHTKTTYVPTQGNSNFNRLSRTHWKKTDKESTPHNLNQVSLLYCMECEDIDKKIDNKNYIILNVDFNEDTKS